MIDTRSTPLSAAHPGSSASAGPGTRPFFIPAELEFDSLSLPLQQAITEIIDPLYEERVLQARTALERSEGLTYVILTWLELVELMKSMRILTESLPRGQESLGDGIKLGPYMKIIRQKNKVAKFLVDTERYFLQMPPVDPLRVRSR